MVDKICKIEMDLASIVKDAERTRFGLQTDGRIDGMAHGQTDGREM